MRLLFCTAFQGKGLPLVNVMSGSADREDLQPVPQNTDNALPEPSSSFEKQYFSFFKYSGKGKILISRIFQSAAFCSFLTQTCSKAKADLINLINEFGQSDAGAITKHQPQAAWHLLAIVRRLVFLTGYNTFVSPIQTLPPVQQ